jgi:hypothetical protein
MTTKKKEKPQAPAQGSVGPEIEANRKPRGPAAVSVGPETEWTDYHGFLKLFGVRRSTADHLVKDGVFKSISLKHGDEKRGKRLFHVPSARQYLNDRLVEVAAKAKVK